MTFEEIMSDQANSTRSEKQVLSKAVLLERIDHYRLMLEDTIRGLDEEQLSQPGLEGWSIKDHLAHLGVGIGMVELLQRLFAWVSSRLLSREKAKTRSTT
jgi:hypothetical protein